MIEGVQTKQLTTYPDERGFFREILRSTDEIFSEGFGQWSHSLMYSGTIKAFHFHFRQVDWWYVPIGVIKAVLVDCRGEGRKIITGWSNPEWNAPKAHEYLLGDNQPAQVLRIPPGVAHGLKVLQGPAHLFYVTSKEYDGTDEGRIAHDALGYDWDRREIK